MKKMDHLKDVNPVRSLFLNDEEITKYIFMTKRLNFDPSENYDVGMVLGCSIYEIMHRRCEDALKLYEQGIIKQLVLSGGIGYISKEREESEASYMKRFMLEHGVDEKYIVSESKSSDTAQNMKNSIEFVERECGNNGKVIVITSDFHQKRAYGLLIQLICNRIKLAEKGKINTSSLLKPENVFSAGVNDGKYDFDKWYLLPKSDRGLIKTEVFMDSLYALTGKIPNFKITDIDKTQRERI